MKTYFIKIALKGVSPMVWRRLRIPGNTSLAQLHHIIQIANQWEDEYLHQFHIYGKDYGISYAGGIAFADHAKQVFLDDFGFDIGDKFTYEYNFFEHWVVDIRIENVLETVAKNDTIYCIKGNGMLGASKYDETEQILNLLTAIVNANKRTTLEDIQSFVDAVNAVKFNRHLVNHRFKTEGV